MGTALLGVRDLNGEGAQLQHRVSGRVGAWVYSQREGGRDGVGEGGSMA